MATATKLKLIEFKPEDLVIRAKALSFDGIKIDRAGINYQLTTEEVDRLVAHPDFPRYHGKGLEIKEAEMTEAEVIDPKANAQFSDLSGFTLAQIDEVVNSTHDTEILKKWLAEEKRVKARRAIENRIDAIGQGQNYRYSSAVTSIEGAK